MKTHKSSVCHGGASSGDTPGVAPRRRRRTGVSRMLCIGLAMLMVLAACGPGDDDDAGPASESDESADEGAEPEDGAAEDGAPMAGGAISVGTTQQIPSLDPHLEGSVARQQVTFLMYENLVYVDSNLEPQPRLAESWDRVDDTTFVFHLRDDVVFHNGEPMDAEDVKYSYDRLIDPDVGSPGAGDVGFIESIEVVDPLTVQFNLASPSAAFLRALGGKYSAVMPKDFAEDSNPQNEVVGTGPFMLEEWLPDQRLVLVRNPDYWDPERPYLDEISFEVIPDETVMVSQLRTGGLDLALLEEPQNFEELGGDDGLVAETAESLVSIEFFMANDLPPTDDQRVRLAMKLAIDRNAVLEATTRGLGTVIGAAPPALSPYAADMSELPNQERDLDRARELLAEAGYADGLEFTFRTITGRAAYLNAAQVIQSNLAEVGIDATIDAVDIGVWIDDLVNFRQLPTMNNAGGGADPDLLWFRHFHSRPDGADFRNWNSPEADALLEAGRTTFDEDERIAIYKEYQVLVSEDVPTIPLYSPYQLVVRRAELHDYVQHPATYYDGLRDAWLEQ